MPETPVTKAELEQALAAVEERMTARLQEAVAALVERIRDAQTELLRGFERYARSNTARFVRLEAGEVSTADRLANLEERMLEIEKRILLHPPAA